MATMDSSVTVENDPSDESMASETAYEPLDREAGECLYDDMGDLDEDLDEKGIEVAHSRAHLHKSVNRFFFLSMGYLSRRN